MRRHTHTHTHLVFISTLALCKNKNTSTDKVLLSLTPQLLLNDRHTVQLPNVAVAEVHRDTGSPVLFIRKMKRTELVPASMSTLKKRNRVCFFLEKRQTTDQCIF